MARLSATSSAVDTNGHVKEPTTVPLSADDDPAPPKPLVDDTEVPNHDDDDSEDEAKSPSSDTYPVAPDPTLLPGGSRDLSLIGIQAFCLGVTFATGMYGTWYLALRSHPQWRLPAFALCLSLFHFLEYWTTAAYNTPACRASSFLLFNNGRAYTFANVFAMVEIILSWWFPDYLYFGVHPVTILAGLCMVVVGQVVRSVAMVQASTNFNHIVQSERKDTHMLVTRGLYGYFRHPSYFGFFWWSVGTQLLVGNKVCLVGFAIVLYRFFARRIFYEEKHLVDFFGDDYKEFRKRTGTMMPFIR